MKFATLYGKDQAGGLKLWEVYTEGNKIVVRHGKLGGKIQEKATYATPKNIGKANETSPAQQASLEAAAKWVKQHKKGYFTTKEEALAFVNKMPMKAQNYNDYADRIKRPCYVQPKLNGLRILIDDEGEAQSKQGEPYKLPEHWLAELDMLRSAGYLEFGLDGEVFAGYQKQGGLSLQQINAAFKKPNKDTERLKLYVYDIPVEGVPQAVRIAQLESMKKYITVCGLCHIKVVDTPLIEGIEDELLYAQWLTDGAEGMVYRNTDALYEYGKRSYNLIKRKPRQDAEALVVDAREDKNGDGVLTCMLPNGVHFECLMRKDSHPTINYRKMENAGTLLQKFITFEYEELSDAGVPTKPVGTGIREMDPGTWEPKE